MANQLYASGKFGLLTKLIDLSADDIRVVLVDSTYVVDLAAHDFLDDIAVGKRVAMAALSGKSVSAAGVFDASDITFVGLAGSPVHFLALCKYTGVDATSRLIAYWDQFANKPFMPTGNDLVLAWNNDVDKILILP